MLVIIIPFDFACWVITGAAYISVSAVTAIVVSQMAVDVDAIFLDWIYGERKDYIPPFFKKKLLK